MHRKIGMGMNAVLMALAAAGLSAQVTVVNGGGGTRIVTSDIGTGPLTSTSTTPMPAGTGLIFGQAIEGGSTQPISGALVTLSLSGSVPVRVLADGEGHFVFRDVPKGHFSLEATKPGYGAGAYGRLRPGGPTQSIELTDGQLFPTATIPLWRLGAISGTVVDENGDPVVAATVRLLKRTLQGGSWQLTSVGQSSDTDDRGRYRIGSLEPGEYVVGIPMSQQPLLDSLSSAVKGAQEAAQTLAFRVRGGVAPGGGTFFNILTGGTGPAGMADDGTLLWYPTTFFPNVAAGSKATPVVVPLGSDKAGVDFTLRADRTHVVGGIVNGPKGPASGLTVSLYPADAQGIVTPLEAAAALTDGAGHFSFPRVPPGRYTLRIVDQPRAIFAGDAPMVVQNGNVMTISRMVIVNPAAPLPTDPTLWLDSTVTVDTADVPDLGLSLRTGLRVSGQVEFDGAAARPTADQLQSLLVSLQPADAQTSASTSNARGRLDGTGTFTTVGVPSGSYVLRLGAPNGWTLERASYNGHDISDEPVEITDADIDGVNVVYTDRPPSLSGTVTTGGTADPKAAVIVFPADPSAWASLGPTPRRAKNLRAGADGHFSVSLPAGDYLVVAVNDADAGDWNDPRFLTAIAPTATRVTLSDGDKKTEALRTVAAPAIQGGGL